jgi:hypothetical protein
MSQSPFPGPIAPENNPPINPQYYQPSVFDISAISLGSTTTVTTSVNHNYVIGQNTRLLIPFFYGSTQLNQAQGLVIAIPTLNQVVLNINSIGANAFIASPSQTTQKAQIVAIGDQNSGSINVTGRSNTGTYIPGAFIDISPA